MQEQHRRAFLAVALLLAPVLAGGAAPAAAADPALVAAARKEGEVIWYTTQIINQLVRPMVAGFEKAYPGIKVSAVRANATDTAIKLLNEGKAGRMQADVFDGTTTVVPLKEAGLVMKYVPDSAKALPKDYIDADGYWVATNIYVLTPGYNTDLVKKADAPKTLQDLLAPKWRGHIAWGATESSSAGPGFIGTILAEMGEDKGMAYLKQLSGQKLTNISLSAREILDQVIAGEYPLALQIFNHHTVISAKKGAPSAWIKMEPATVVLQVASVAKGAAHPNAAKLLLDYMVSDEGQTYFRDADYLPASPRVQAPDPTLKPEGGHFKATVFSPSDVEDRMPKWKQIFDQYFR